VRDAGELTIRLLSLGEFDALPPPERESFVQRLDLQESYCRQKWERGDLVVLAEAAGRPVGIVWCARTPVYVPDIGREVRPGPGECYIHDVYVHPDERGRQVAPAMLEFLARELRARDVYRGWALIERTNTSSVRAFEKAAYASVADVVYVRMGLASRLLIRPPDPEARSFLGLA
jgi:GNAT superfamily N-acetyltransferase